MKNFFAIIGIIFLIVAVVAVGVLGYYSKGFKDWSFFDGASEAPDQSDPTTPGGSTNPGGSTTPSGGETDHGGDTDPDGETDPGGSTTPDVSDEQWEVKTYRASSQSLDDNLSSIGLQEYAQGFVLSLPNSQGDVGISFAVLSKEQGETSKWYFTTFSFYKPSDVKILYYTENGFASLEFKITSNVKILGIVLDPPASTPTYWEPDYYIITYAVKKA